LIQEIDEHSSEEETFAAMEAISGVPIPPDEIADGSAGQARQKKSSRASGPAGGAQNPLSENSEMQAGSLNSVAALFAGLGMQNGLLAETDDGAAVSDTNASMLDAKGDS
jgi:hypothetical protein